MKRLFKILLPLIIFFFLACLLFFAVRREAKPSANYGVFPGIGRDETKKLENYSVVVIEPSEFIASDIQKLREDGKEVFGYLNIGAIEEYRPYFKRFEHVTLSAYENWPDERWIDVSSEEWQNFIVESLGNICSEMGFDGLFLDNADIYYHYPNDEIFSGIVRIVSGLKKYGFKLIINGGDTFVSRCIELGTAKKIFDGVNQECVFTSIDFENKTYGMQNETDKKYFQDYLERVKSDGLSVFLLEYRADSALSAQITAYCKENGFLWYNAGGKDLG